MLSPQQQQQRLVETKVTTMHQYGSERPREFTKKAVGYCSRVGCNKPIFNFVDWVAEEIPNQLLCYDCSRKQEQSTTTTIRYNDNV